MCLESNQTSHTESISHACACVLCRFAGRLGVSGWWGSHCEVRSQEPGSVSNRVTLITCCILHCGAGVVKGPLRRRGAHSV